MSTPDPFAAFESERTVIKPRPKVGGASGLVSPPPSAPAQAAAPLEPVDVASLGALNPLVAHATGLLSLVGYLRTLVQSPDVNTLRGSLISALQRFEAGATRSGASKESIVAARYVLCTALDESVSNTPWGVQAAWSKQSLLVQFHNETWGGEKVFQLLAKLAQDVPANRALLELIYCVLALGFEGRYRVIDNGRAQLDAVRQRLADLIRKARPTPEADLSPHWRSQDALGQQVRHSVPLWLIACGAAAVLALIYVLLHLSLNNRSDGTFTALSNLRVPGVQIVAPAARPAAKPRLAGLLEPEVREGLVTILEQDDKSIIRLNGDKFFASGSAEPMSQTQPVLQRIAQGLSQVPGDVLITGHSDNQPIRSLRFPSNWHLSTARAENVKNALAVSIDPARLRFAGQADSEPVAPNDSPENRARNRRVDITLFPPTQTSTPRENAK